MVGTRIDLSVRLRRDGGNLHRAYSYPPYGHRPELDVMTRWDDLQYGIRFGDLSGPSAAASLLDRGKAEELASFFTRSKLVAIGEMLFELLFAGDTQRLFRGLFKQTSGPAPNPPRYPVRVRVVSEDALLASLPWRVTAWKGRWLLDSGWTFETAVREDVKRKVELRAPVKILVVTPGGGEPLGEDDHFGDLREALLKISPHYEDLGFLSRVRSREELIDALRGMAPDIVYYYGHGTVDGGQACLLLANREGEPQPLTMGDLRRQFGDSPPAVVYLNACSSAAAGWQSAGHQLTPEVACVIAQRTTVWTESSGAAAVRWFEDFLGQGLERRGLERRGLDPVLALHQRDGSTRGFEWTTAVAWTHFDSWITHSDVTPPRLREVGLRLDRDSQRALAHKHVAELIDSRARRVEALVACGSEGTLVEQFARQVKDYLEGNGISLRWIRLGTADRNDMAFDRLEEELGLWLERGDFEAMASLLRRHAPSQRGGSRIPVLGLDWGVFGADFGRRLSSDELRDWLLFASDVLARDCPPDIRVVSYLALEVPEESYTELERTMEEARADIRSQAFRCVLLPALTGVTLTNVLDYLEDPTNTHCPPSSAAEAARLIYRQTAGRYEETVELIARGEEDGWNRLLRKLRQSHAAGTSHDRVVF